ncbi:MAG: 16S rRNA (guanine(966)-N(2))-methyltransferase RsmD [Thermodesulfobacteriota bacterium]
MRISGGELLRREIKTPKGNDTRPTSGVVRESIFNIIGNSALDIRVLDLYSGSGAFGIEAISRGAASCIFAEKEALPLKCIEKNLKTLKIEDKGEILKKNLPDQIKTIYCKESFDLIFLDPPYSNNLLNKTLEEIRKTNLASDKTLIIAEHSKKEMPDSSFFELLQTRKYGKSLVSFFNCML